MKHILVIAIALLFSIGSFAQKKGNRMNLNKTDIILVVDKSGENIYAMELMIGETEKNLMNKLKKTYPSSKFYKGIIEGDYSVGKRNIVTPKKEAIVTMFTKKEFVIIPLQVEFSPKVSIGDTFNVSGIKTKIINKRKGKLKFKYY